MRTMTPEAAADLLSKLTPTQRAIVDSEIAYGHPAAMRVLARHGLVKPDGRRPLVSGRGSICGTAQDWKFTLAANDVRIEMHRAEDAADLASERASCDPEPRIVDEWLHDD